MMTELSTNSEAKAAEPICSLCGKGLGQLPPQALNKRFCSPEHRKLFHKQRYQHGARLLAELELKRKLEEKAKLLEGL